jgi:hypothetical protein
VNFLDTELSGCCMTMLNRKKYIAPLISIKQIKLEHGFLVGSQYVQINEETREEWKKTIVTAEFDWDAWWNNN